MSTEMLLAIIALFTLGSLIAILLLSLRLRQALWSISSLAGSDANSVRKIVANSRELIENKIAQQIDDAVISVQNAVSVAQLNMGFPVFLGDSSIDSFHAKYLVQFLVENQPRAIVELGSGSSTMLIARVLKSIGIKEVFHVSVDHEARYLEQSKRFCQLADVDDRVHFLHAPLGPVDCQDDLWYTGLTEALADRKIEFVFVDGPPAHVPGLERSRYGALPLLQPYLAEHCTIILDDANRTGEQEIIDRWMAEFPGFSLSRIERGKGVAVLSR